MKIESIGPHIVVPSVDWQGDSEAAVNEASSREVRPVKAGQEMLAQEGFERSPQEALARLISFAEAQRKKRESEQSRRLKKAMAAYQRHLNFAKDLACKGNEVTIKV